jgi:hypothetical protein
MPLGQEQSGQSESQSAPQSEEELLFDSWSQHSPSSDRAAVATAIAPAVGTMAVSCVVKSASKTTRSKPSRRIHPLVGYRRPFGQNTNQG